MALTTRPPGSQQGDWYFFMWKLTDAGVQDAQAVKESIRRASQMVVALGGRCRLYVTLGGKYDMIGIADGITDQQASQLRHAVNALGHFRTTTFLKARDFYLEEFDGFTDSVTKLVSG